MLLQVTLLEQGPQLLSNQPILTPSFSCIPCNLSPFIMKPFNCLGGLALLFFSLYAHAQVPSWALIPGSPGYKNYSPQFLSTAPDGGIFLAGNFRDTIDFDPSPGIFNLTTPPGNWDLFLQKLDSAGQLDYALAWNPTGSMIPEEIIALPDGGIVLAGYYSGTMDADPGPQQHLISTPPFDGESYLIRLNASGQFLWVKSFKGLSFIGGGLGVDHANNIYAAGFFFETIDFDPDTGQFFLTPYDFGDYFQLKLDPQGNFLWANQTGSTSSIEIFNDFAVDSIGNSYLYGVAKPPTDLDPGLGVAMISGPPVQSTFIRKLDPQGNFLWGKTMESYSTPSTSSAKIAVSPDESCFISGSFTGQVDADPGTNNHWLFGTSFEDGFISKLDQNGDFQWAKHLGFDSTGATNYMRIRHLETEASGNILVAGVFEGTGIFDITNTVQPSTLTDSNLNSTFLVEWSPTGFLNALHNFGGYHQEMKTGNNNEIYFMGTCSPGVEFDPINGGLTLVFPDSSSRFLVKWEGADTTTMVNVEEKLVFPALRAFPNPTRDKVFLETKFNSGNLSVKVINLLGEIVLPVQKINRSPFEITLPDHPGIYLMEVISNNQKEVIRVLKTE